MTIKPSLAAVAAVFSVALFLAPSAHAEDKKPSATNAKAPVIVAVQAGDSLSSIADAHSTTYVRLFDENGNISDPNIINPGDQIRIPDANEQLPDRMAQITTTDVVAAVSTPVAQPTVGTYYRSVPSHGYYVDSAGNTYYNGYCTWYAKSRRPDLPNMLGNGGQWVANAAARGYATGSTPRAGAIAETAGHVAYVESVNNDGTINISEMNGPGGFGVVDKRTVPASQYNYIY